MLLLARLYTPGDFGIFGALMSVSIVISAIACGRYELAIMLPEKDDDAWLIALLSIIILSCTCLLSVLLLFLFNDQIVMTLDLENNAGLLYLVPFLIFLLGAYNIFNYICTREKKFKVLAESIISKSLSGALSQIILSYFISGAGLVVGYCISVLVSLYSLVRHLSIGSLRLAAKTKGLSRVAKRYINFPQFSLFAALFSSLSSHSLTVMIPFFYGLEAGGFYFLIQRVLGIPSSIIGGAIGQSYFQRAVEEKNLTGYAVETFNFASLALILISLCFFIPIYIILPLAIELFFGVDWIPAVAMGEILLPLVAMQFISAALSNTNNIFEKQKLALIWQFGMFMITFLSLILSFYYGLSFLGFLSIYAKVGAAYYLFLFFILKAVAVGRL